VPRPKRAKIGVLNHVIGVRLVASQRQRKTINVVEPREGFPLKRYVSLP